MAQTNISIRIDEDLKKQFDEFCSNVGMSMTTAFCIFAKTVVNEQKIPFEIRSHKPNEATLAAINEVKRMKEDHSVGKSYSDVDDMMEDLLN